MARLPSLVFALSIALLAPGCGSRTIRVDPSDDDDGHFNRASCNALCDQAAACPGVDVGDCEEQCDELERQAAQFGCGSELDAVLTCVADTGDVCGDSPACAGESEAFVACLGGPDPDDTDDDEGEQPPEG